jgi:hypothetical protein
MYGVKFSLYLLEVNENDPSSDLINGIGSIFMPECRHRVAVLTLILSSFQ